ncbi:MAG: pyridoxamine 5'-phosphate oxidase [Candidatus Microbacterium phytovorans]|uniref:Pyridoxine/pyridoxamine 5'-phosphate oxidase n=1 Tax=Candidatus Microbacterium phytovorans TaxID=3121374 RepID=A0AAJ5VZU3_9MICO|nr:pyridoxamine 5'-phosphate oxidase [Microbacterium sp.]WEK13122.1 MAG: pyridoxamine 5'-phosphate oxidase [Microbacterium sp.]
MAPAHDDDAALSRHTDYGVERLEERDLSSDPVAQFRRWLGEAADRGVYEPNAMVLGTIGADGDPQSRTVLLRGVDERGFVFFTDRSSRKGQALAAHPAATLLFPWYVLHRQVIVTGDIAFVSDAESDAYWESRPHGSRVAATASAQSQPVAGRGEFEAQVRAVEERYPEGTAVPRPPRWGGYRLAPRRVEFWQGRTSRLHDRLVFTRAGESWGIERLQP